ncbi:MAG: hypothetical protein WBW93_16725 [Steroidobacteraceae bacterium]
MTRHNPAAQAGRTRCVEAEVFFHAEQCKKELPKGGGLTEKSRHSRSWFECDETTAESWIPTKAQGGANLAYKAEVGASDAQALTALLAPLAPQARATLTPEDLKGSFQKAFQGPGRWSFFILGNGSTVTAFAVTNLDDFQFTDIATDVSSSATAASGSLDFETMAEDAGITLSYHTEFSRRAMPPPGGMVRAP